MACSKWAGLCVIKVCSSLLSLSLGRGCRFLITRLQQAETVRVLKTMVGGKIIFENKK